MQNNSILIAGSIALDTIEIGNEKYGNLLGGSTTYAMLAAGRFVPVHIVGIIGDDFPRTGHALFNKYAADLTDLEIQKGKTFSWGGRYHENFDDRDTLFTDLGVFGDYKPKLSEINQKHQYIFLANIHPVLQELVIDQSQPDALIVVDTMNLWITTTLKELLSVIKKITVLLINESEAIMLTKNSNLDEAAKALIALGPNTIVIKRGSKGAILYNSSQKKVSIGVYPIKRVADPTGAGDSFGGGFIAALAQGKSYEEALVLGTATASICVEEVGVSGLDKTTISEINHRKKILQNSLHLENQVNFL